MADVIKMGERIVVKPTVAQLEKGRAAPPGSKKGEVRPRRAIKAEELARRFDLLLGQEMARALKSVDPPEADFLAIVERRLKALGETKKPAVSEKGEGGKMTALMAELAEEERKARGDEKEEGGEGGGVEEHGGI